MKISELSAELINTYGDVEVVEMLHIEDLDSPEPYAYKEVTVSTLIVNAHVHPTDLLTYCGHNREKHFVSANMRGYISGKMEKALLLDLSRYVEEEEEDEDVKSL